MEKKDLEAVAEVVKKHDLFVISDEIYSALTYTEKHISIASLPGMKERTIVINGFSKSHAMTGWRLGYACGPRIILDQMLKFISMQLCVHRLLHSMQQWMHSGQEMKMSRECGKNIMAEEDI